MYDIIIIGAGPAGISAGIYAVSRGKSTLIIEKEQVGGLIGKVSTVTHYAAIIATETGASYARRLKEQAVNAGVKFCYEEVAEAVLEGSTKKVTTNRGTYESKVLILANGTTPVKLGIPGEEELSGRGVRMNAAKHAPQYEGKHVYVVGGADGAVKEALYLAKTAAKVTIIHFEEKLAAIAEFMEKVEAAENIEVCLNTRLTGVYGDAMVEKLELTSEITGEKTMLEDPGCGVFVYAGSAPNTGLYEGLQTEGGFITVNEKMETSIPCIYAAGDIRTKQVRQAATAVADGAIAGINAAAACN